MTEVFWGVLAITGAIFAVSALLLVWSLCAMSSRLDDADDAEALAALAAERARQAMSERIHRLMKEGRR